LELSNQANGFKEQSTSLAIKTCPESGVGNVLAGETSADDIDGLEVVRPALADVSLSVDGWPVFRKHSVCILVDLHLPLALHACTLEP
jgi:hypothetical protein